MFVSLFVSLLVLGFTTEPHNTWKAHATNWVYILKFDTPRLVSVNLRSYSAPKLTEVWPMA